MPRTSLWELATLPQTSQMDHPSRRLRRFSLGAPWLILFLGVLAGTLFLQERHKLSIVQHRD